MDNIIPNVVLQHAENAAFLFSQRRKAVVSPNHDLIALTALDERISANLDGLLLAGEDGWKICKEELRWEEYGEIAAAAALALLSDGADRIREVMEVVGKDNELLSGLSMAFGWLPFEKVETSLQELLLDSDAQSLREVGIEACAFHRRDPGLVLKDLVSQADLKLRRPTLLAVAELGRKDLVGYLRTRYQHGNADSAEDALCAAGRLGDELAIGILKTEAEST